MKRFITRFRQVSIQGVLDDREFVGETWRDWLNREQLPFLIRMRFNQHYQHNGRGKPVSALFRSLTPGESRVLRKPRLVKGQSVYLSGLRLPDGKLLIVDSNQRLSKPIETYRLHWQIEVLFQSLKGLGFQMETDSPTTIGLRKWLRCCPLGFAGPIRPVNGVP